MNKIIVAGGCFWGVEAYFKQKTYIKDSTVGYVNSNMQDPDYRTVCTGRTDAAEAVELTYEGELEEILDTLFHIIDPTVMNRQGNDHGSQYRTGIYYKTDKEKDQIEDYIRGIQGNYRSPIVTEVVKADNFWPAEDYHQDYLDKNPGGYCHIDLNS